ncbi:MAG: PQQ-binding-like beta-propeller repeat protein, partial [Candidatus Sericytochromatia bacterium]
DNLTARIGLYTNDEPDNVPLVEYGSAFHVADAETQGEITLSTEGLLVADMVDELRDMGSDELNTPIDLEDYDGFAENFLAQLNQTSDEFQENINVHELASDINSGALDPSASSGSSTDPTTLSLATRQAAYLANAGSAGLNFPLPVNQLDKTAYLMDEPGSSSSTVSLYVVNTDPTTIETLTGTKEKRYPQVFKTETTFMSSRAMSLGRSNSRLPVPLGSIPPGETKNSSQGMTYGVRLSSTAGQLDLQARLQETGVLSWSYNFNGAAFSSQAENIFVPVLKRVNKGGCTCDDEDLVMVAFKGTGAGDSESGIHALQTMTGTVTKKWFYQYVSPATSTAAIFQSGALSADGATLFALAKDSSSNAFLVALKTSPTSPPAGEKLWSVQLNGSLGVRPSMALGTDGTIYVFNSQGGTAYLQAYDPGNNGSLKWEKQLSGTVPASGSPIVDRQNSADIVYAAAGGKLYAYDSSGNAKWDAPVDLAGYSPYFSPLVGQEDSGRHVIYVAGFKSFGNVIGTVVSRIFAVADDGTMVWSRAPWSVTLAAGFTLLDGRLLFTTLDGGEANFSQLQGIKVSTNNMPLDAPWPKIYGNLRNSGSPYTLSRTEDYLL